MFIKIYKKIYSIIIVLTLCATIIPMQALGNNCKLSQIKETIYVDDDAIFPGQGTLSAPYNSIQYAIEKSNNGYDIKIASGEYFENVLIDKQITLDWHGGDINGTDSGKPIINAGGTGINILIRYDDVTIKQCHITNSGKTDLDAGIYIGEESSNVKILNNEITNCYSGIWAKRYIAVETNHEIRDNMVDNIDQYGILLHMSDGNSIYNNVVSNCSSFGLHIVDCIENRIKENIFSNNKIGIALDVGMENEVEGNCFINNTNYGIVLVNTQKTVITNNDFIDNGIIGATWINCRGDKWFHNYWGSTKFVLYIVWGLIRGPDMSIPWFKIEINPSPTPNIT